MTLGFQRLNERHKRPNEHIDFIKPDPTSSREDQAIAEQFLSKIAAQCFPVLKKHHIYIRTLEEYEPNPEFLGRNFNAGECSEYDSNIMLGWHLDHTLSKTSTVQLVLKDKRGRWLDFRFVQMVMMHELAHCKQMNHSRYFWKVRNEYAKQMEELWKQGYEGEGIWGRGQNLSDGQFAADRMPEGFQMPEHLCGGAYRRTRGKKRKRGRDGADTNSNLTYAERQQKRIARKFGKHGEGAALGEDELVRGALDASVGKRQVGKPRVANSKRGRELRAAAALARFEAAKAQTSQKPKPQTDDEEDGSDWSSDDDLDASEYIVLTQRAGGLQDQHGNDVINVCADDGDAEGGGEQEMAELLMLSRQMNKSPSKAAQTTTETEAKGNDNGSETESEGTAVIENGFRGNAAAELAPTSSPVNGTATAAKFRPISFPNYADDAKTVTSTGRDPSGSPVQVTTEAQSGLSTCPICSLENDSSSPTCIACSHVLKPALVKNHWRCRSDACTSSKYINAGDVGRCGLCGSPKPKVEERVAIGTTSNDLLRWD